ncbi:acetate uptake transporter [Curtobacterium ammoniigenes]|uniref:acetate uptake transporter n=1 Tax=Curtobacterium ammoniigenes TaxID=395387 RepID=UPI0009F9F017|nr:GPR1/FUN34/YaaH family transporter [Curtobacterium ammoniigenes]
MSSAPLTSRHSSSVGESPAVIPQSAPLENAAPAVTPFADPGPLGLAAFALTTFVLSFANAGIIPTAGAAVLGLAAFYGGLGQLIAGIWEFANKNTFGATAFCTYGGFWLAFWYLVSTKGDVAAGGSGVGIFLIGFGIFTLYMTIAATKTNGALIAVFAFLTLTFFALGIGAAAGSSALSHIGGYLGIITALLAWYTSFAIVTNSTFKRIVLPVFPRP